MSKAHIGDQEWAQLNEAQKIAAVFAGHASLKQMSEGLLDGSEQLRRACREILAQTSPALENLLVDDKLPETSQESTNYLSSGFSQHINDKTEAHPATFKNRFGLPEGFVPRLHRYGRSVLLELNVYRLPDGREFIVSRPTGTLGASRHRYALLTSEQYLQGRRGSVYVRTDGRIFDYSVDSSIPLGDIFDTGYTISDLERTGRYAPELRPQKKKRPQAKVKRATAG